MKILFLYLGTIIWGMTAAFGQGENAWKRHAGPMVGYAEMREVMLWVQTNVSAVVHFTYAERDVKDAPVWKTAAVRTSSQTAHTAHCLADKVLPDKKYEAKLFVDGEEIILGYPIHFQTRSLWKWRTDPPDFKVVFGSCAYIAEPAYDRPGKAYGGGYEIFTAMTAQSPDLMLWLGDNVYFREADYNTRTGMLYRYTHDRAQAEIQPLLAACPNYAIWDDHDFGPDDSDRSFVHKEKAREVFQLFWANPSYGLADKGITSMFTWSDCDFFLLDNRYFRSQYARVTGERTMFGKVQLEWLLDALKKSKSPFKFVCTGGMILSTAKIFEDYINLFPEERQWLLDRIQKEKISGVIFLTGDRHHTEMSKWHPEGGVAVYDITVSPLTAGPYQGDGDQNIHLIPGTVVDKRNFGVLEVTGPDGKRKLKVSVHNGKGKTVWEQEIIAQ